MRAALPLPAAAAPQSLGRTPLGGGGGDALAAGAGARSLGSDTAGKSSVEVALNAQRRALPAAARRSESTKASQGETAGSVIFNRVPSPRDGAKGAGAGRTAPQGAATPAHSLPWVSDSADLIIYADRPAPRARSSTRAPQAAGGAAGKSSLDAGADVGATLAFYGSGARDGEGRADGARAQWRYVEPQL